MKIPSPIIPYRWTVLDATAAELCKLVDIWATPYKIWPRDLDRGERRLVLPSITESETRAVGDGELELPARMDADPGFVVGEQISFSLGLTCDPPSVARFFRPGYEWVDVPDEVDLEGRSVQQVMEACHAHDPERFAHFDPAVVAATFAARLSAKWLDWMPRSPLHLHATALNPYRYPWGDLAMLHFEYWENTDWRAALINQHADFDQSLETGWLDALKGLGTVALYLLKGDPWTGIWGSLWPWTIPAVEGDHRIQKVLARLPDEGAPVAALPTIPDAEGEAPRAGRVVHVVSIPPPRIELDGFGPQVVSPLQDPVPLTPGGRQVGGAKVRFLITIPFSAHRVRIEILRGDAVYYREIHDGGEYLVPGTHAWSWDAFDQSGVYDTAALVSGELTARVKVTDVDGRTSVGASPLATGKGRYRWVDVRCDRRAKQFDVTCFQQFKHPSDMTLFEAELPIDLLSDVVGDAAEWMAKASSSSGGAMGGMLAQVGNVLPSASSGLSALLDQLRRMFDLGGGGDGGGSIAQQYAAAIPGIFHTDSIEVGSKLTKLLQSGADLAPEQFDRFGVAILEGIRRHWSREVTIGGETWSVETHAKLRGYDAQVVYLSSEEGTLGAIRGGDADRSFNLGALVEGLPCFNIMTDGDLLPESHVERGWVTDVWARLACTGAHEIGHTVLMERKDWLFSITHKGTSTIGQKRLPDAPFHVESIGGEANWEIDIMYYYNDNSIRPPENWQARYTGSEEDTCVLASMGKVVFGG